MADAGSLTEILFERAIQQANELDEHFKEHGRLVGPLHGICMTLKDQFDVQGFDSTLGYVGRAFKPAMQDCVLVSLLKHLGAIVIAKSNLPQSIMVRHRQKVPLLPIPSLMYSHSGVKLRIRCGDSPCIRTIPNSPLGAQRAEKAPFCRYKAP